MVGKMTIMAKLIVAIVAAVVVSSTVLTYITMNRQKVQMLAEVKSQARMAADQLISARKVIAEKQKAINTDSKGGFEYKGVIPAIVGREIAEYFSKTTIFKMKQTSLKYRNPANKPDAWESRQLARFEAETSMRAGASSGKPESWDLNPAGKYGTHAGSDEISEITKLEDGTEVFRLMVPLRIEESCLKCHGDPATSPTGDGKDVAGRQMENYKLGEIRGGISVIAPMAAVNAAIASNRNFSILGNGIYVLLISGIVFFITRGVVGLLKRMIGHLTSGANEVTAASGQISSSSQFLADGASQQASSLEETSASIEQMASMTARSADSARETNQLAIKTKTSAEQGSQALETMQATMRELNSGNDKVLSIIKSIDEIAFQTNLLALNAAVEAARAGEHGRGFAVVAEEVRNLAQRCSMASKETAELIHARVASTENAAKIAEKFAENLKEIVVEAKKVTDLAGEISASSQEQSEGINQISKAVSTMDTVTQQNAASAEELASSSEELSAQAENLKAIVNELAREIGATVTDGAEKPPVKAIQARATSHSQPAAPKRIKPARQTMRHGVAVKPVVKSRHEGDVSGRVDKPQPKSPEEIIPLGDDFKDF